MPLIDIRILILLNIIRNISYLLHKVEGYHGVSAMLLFHIVKVIFSSPGLCPWRAYVVTQSLASVGVCVGVRVSTMFKFSKVFIVF